MLTISNNTVKQVDLSSCLAIKNTKSKENVRIYLLPESVVVLFYVNVNWKTNFLNESSSESYKQPSAISFLRKFSTARTMTSYRKFIAGTTSGFWTTRVGEGFMGPLRVKFW